MVTITCIGTLVAFTDELSCLDIATHCAKSITFTGHYNVQYGEAFPETFESPLKLPMLAYFWLPTYLHVYLVS